MMISSVEKKFVSNSIFFQIYCQMAETAFAKRMLFQRRFKMSFSLIIQFI
jgi:hypothetical protein